MRKKSDIKYPNCPECNKTENVIKNGYFEDKARYYCKECKCRFIPKEMKNIRIPSCEFLDLKIICILLYCSDYKAKEIFEYFIKPSIGGNILNNSNSYKIIQQWAKDYRNGEEIPRKTIKTIKYIQRQKDFDSKINMLKKELDKYTNFIIISFAPTGDKFTLWKQHDAEITYISEKHLANNNKKIIERKEQMTPTKKMCLSLVSFLLEINNITPPEKSQLNFSNKYFNYVYKNYFQPEYKAYYCENKKLLSQELKWEKHTKHIIISYNNDFTSFHLAILARK